MSKGSGPLSAFFFYFSILVLITLALANLESSVLWLPQDSSPDITCLLFSHNRYVQEDGGSFQG